LTALFLEPGLKAEKEPAQNFFLTTPLCMTFAFTWEGTQKGSFWLKSFSKKTSFSTNLKQHQPNLDTICLE